MKRLSTLGVVVVLLAVMVSSMVRADGDPNDPTPKASGVVSVMNSDPDDPDPVVRGAVGSDPIVADPPVDPDMKATPILF